MTLPAEPRLQPYLTVSDAAKAIDFYVAVFGMRERYRLAMPDGRIGHAELELEGLRLNLADEFPESNIQGPTSRGGTTVNLMFYVEDVDAVVAKAVALGASTEGEPQDMFHGNRSAKLVDPFGHRWLVNQRLEDVGIEEIEKRFAAMFEQAG